MTLQKNRVIIEKLWEGIQTNFAKLIRRNQNVIKSYILSETNVTNSVARSNVIQNRRRKEKQNKNMVRQSFYIRT